MDNHIEIKFKSENNDCKEFVSIGGEKIPLSANIKDIKLKSTKDGKRLLISRKGDNFPEINQNAQQKFLDIIKPLNLPEPVKVFLQAYQIVYGEILNDASLAEYMRPNECDEDIKRFFEMMLSLNNYDDIEGMRLGFRLKGKEEIQSFTLNEQEFVKKVIPCIMDCYLKTLAPTRFVKSYLDQKLISRDMVKKEVERLENAKQFAKKHFQHRPNSNQRKYCLLLLFFDILKIEQCKANYYLMIDVMQLFNLWDNDRVDDNSYRLVNRQWHLAKTYKLVFW